MRRRYFFAMAKLWLAPLKPVGRFGESLLDRVLCVAGALSFAQAPEFFQQYLQRLGGHLDEARRVLARFESVAQASGVSLQELISLTRAQAAKPVANLGDVIAEAQARVASLAEAERALREAGAWSRPWAFFRHVDAEIARAAWEVFKPAVPVTPEGFCYAGAGMLAALGLYQLAVVAPCKAWSARRAAKRAGALKP
jgi:hypothetical protein